MCRSIPTKYSPPSVHWFPAPEAFLRFLAGAGNLFVCFLARLWQVPSETGFFRGTYGYWGRFLLLGRLAKLRSGRRTRPGSHNTFNESGASQLQVARKNRFLIVGGGGREGAFAVRLAQDAELYAVIPHENPLIVDCAARSGGKFLVGDPGDPQTVLQFARDVRADYAFINSDQPLANGVVDALLGAGFRAVGGTRDAARIEWDKIYSIGMVQKVCPEFTPFYRVASSPDELRSAMSEFESRGMGVAVKPQGLTGGKGVKVMPEHLQSYADCADYASRLLGKDGRVLLVEKLDGIEFTIMGMTDGRSLVAAPATYDYPFRHEGDRGAGTGGMGCFTGPEGRLPFLTDGDLDDCRGIMQGIIDEMGRNGLLFNGVLNGGFFKTRDGIRFMEFNSRFGDPEALNVLSVLEGSFSDLLVSMWDKTLADRAVSFARKASVVKYLVAPEYPEQSSESTRFTVDEGAMGALGVRTFFASCVRTGDRRYETLKKSRPVAFAALSDGVAEASSLVDRAIGLHVGGGLEYRRDIGSRENLGKLERVNAGLG